MLDDNPLLNLTGWPKFEAILPEHVEVAVDWILARNREVLQQLIDTVEAPEWANFMAPIEQLDDELDRVWAPVSHLVSVKDSKDLRSVYEKCLLKISDYDSEKWQKRDLYQMIHNIRHQGHYEKLDQAKRKAVDDDIKTFHLQGIDLAVQEQQKYREINNELSRLSTQFSNNVLDATDAWYLDVTDESRLVGIPESARDLAWRDAQSVGVTGWRFTLQHPSYTAVITHADDARLREEMYRANAMKASEIGPNGGQWDNSQIMLDILRLRKEKSQLLGYDNYAEYSLATMMAASPDEILGFFRQLSDRCRPAGIKEVDELKQFAKEMLGMDALMPWDYTWASEKLLHHRYGFDEMTLRPYFPLVKVLDGMFQIVRQLFDIEVEAAEAPPVWHPDVQFFRIRDRKGDIRGFFYADFFSRRHKQDGAWMADCVNRRMTSSGIQTPVAFLTCNFSPPSEGYPTLLSHDEVRTLFHEFGHALHHLLTKVDVVRVSGINGVPWDAIELPSQFLENWCWQPETLRLISGHVDTGEPLPAALINNMMSGRHFQSAMHMCRQLEFALFDMRLHLEYNPKGSDSILGLLKAVQGEVAVVDRPSYNRFPHSFSHIFAGGYAAGYYSYLWAEVLSADAFSLFEENGILHRKTGLRFLRWILERGGSEEPMVLFEGFRGRKPTVDALLRHQGLNVLEAAT